MLGSIVVPFDWSSEADRALRLAARLASAAHLPIELIAVSPPGDDSGAEELRDRAAALQPVPCTATSIQNDDPAGALVDAFDARRDALVVLGTNARGPLSELLLGSVSEAVLARTEHPLLLVGPHVRIDAGLGPVLVAAVDRQTTGELLTPTIEDWARAFAAEPWFVQVAPPMRYRERMMVSDISENGLVHRLADVVRHDGVDAQWDVLHGRSTPDALIDFTSSMGGGIVAVASERWADPERIRWTSTARAIVHRSPYPVLVVPIHRHSLVLS